MQTSEAQLDANRLNAQLSTGPRTAEGKQRSSLNALRHGLSSQLVVLPSEDMVAYLAFGQRWLADIHPHGELEKQMVQSLLDTQWKLNRGRSIEHSMFAIGHEGAAGDINVAHPQVHSAMASARFYMQDPARLDVLSRYEQRLVRTFNATLKLLREVMAERKQREADQLHQAGLLRKLHRMENKPFNPAEYGFVLTTAQVDTYVHRQDGLDRAVLAKSYHYNYKKFRAATVSDHPKGSDDGFSPTK